MAVLISSVEAKSIASRKKICSGDSLISINGNEINDVLDYRFYLNDAKLILDIKDNRGKKRQVKIKKDEFEDIGLEFETYLMDKQHTCKNKCIFCFVDQLPKGLRDSLYFKDDDDRLSFLFGNYITLTNLDDKEVDRLIKMHISPINISVHTMNPKLRVKMMANPRAGECLKYIKKFVDSGIAVNTQLVLCPGINDGKELEFSLTELFKLGENINSIACVPVGLSKHREGLYPIEAYSKETADAVIDTVDKFNDEHKNRQGKHIVYAADEFYIYAEREMPSFDYYNDFPQLDNGIGMWALLKEEFDCALTKCDITKLNRTVTLVTGTAAFPLISQLAKQTENKIDGLRINVIAVKNRLFGESITVSGLISGGDILSTLQGKDLGDELIIPPNCLRSEGDMFLDSMTVEQLEKELNIKVRQKGSGGEELLLAFIGE